jgi:hypothetical protein
MPSLRCRYGRRRTAGIAVVASLLSLPLCAAQATADLLPPLLPPSNPPPAPPASSPSPTPPPSDAGRLGLNPTTSYWIYQSRYGTLRGVLVGHSGGDAGRYVTLEADEWPYGDAWWGVKRSTTDPRGNVEFVDLPPLNTRYRLSFKDPVSGNTTTSRVVQVYVYPRPNVDAHALGRHRAFLEVSFQGAERYAIWTQAGAIFRHPALLVRRVYFYARPQRGRFRRIGSARLHETNYREQRAASVVVSETRFLRTSARVLACTRHAPIEGMGLPFNAPECGRRTLPASVR